MEKESWLRTAWAIIVKIAEFIASISQAGLEKLGAEQVEFNPILGVALVLGFALLLGSGCWAASIALSRRHTGWLHFLPGFFLPLIYPCGILFALDLKGESQRRRQLEEERRQKDQQELEREQMLGLQGVSSAEAESPEGTETIWNQRYFERLARTDSGEPAGPWEVVVAGNSFVVLRILAVQESVLLVETNSRDGGIQKLRIPFDKIESWQE